MGGSSTPEVEVNQSVWGSGGGVEGQGGGEGMKPGAGKGGDME